MPEKPQFVGAIWTRKTKYGKDMLSILINGVPYVAFENKFYKEGSNSPKWQIAEPYKDREPARTAEESRQRDVMRPQSSENGPDEVPF